MKALLIPLAALVLGGCATYGDPFGYSRPATVSTYPYGSYPAYGTQGVYSGTYPGAYQGTYPGAYQGTYPGAYGSYPGTVYQAAPYGGYPDTSGRRNRDRDGDGIPNRVDPDRDGDGVPNQFDARPNDPRYR